MNGDNHVADGKWEFDDKVTECFDAMLANSIPDYESMRSLCFNLGKNFVTKGSTVVDLGASRGKSVEQFVEHFNALYPPESFDITGPSSDAVHFVLHEISTPMMAVLLEKFGDVPNVSFCTKTITEADNIAAPMNGRRANLIMSILTIQFTPIEYRLHILDAIYQNLAPGGAFLFVEKVIGNSAHIDRLMVQEYLGMKSGNGYTQEQIDKKRKSLEGVLVPITAKFNEEMLRDVGFRQIDCFYRHLNFAGWLAIK